MGRRGFEVKEGGALTLSYVELRGPITVDAGARALALTDCALNFAAEGAFTGVGAEVAISNNCPDAPPPYCSECADTGSYDPNIAYTSTTQKWTRVIATVTCDKGRATGSITGRGYVYAEPTVERVCQANGSWAPFNPICSPCRSSVGDKCCSPYCTRDPCGCDLGC